MTGDRAIWAYYKCDEPDQRDEQIMTIFAEHGGKWDGQGYYFAGRERDISAMVPEDQTDACIAALTKAGFRVEKVGE